MRKLKLQAQISLDGFMAGPHGEMDWMTLPWSEDVVPYVQQLTESADTIVMGRKLAEGFLPYWASVATDATHPEQSAGIEFSNMEKIVFGRMEQPQDWSNTRITAGDPAEEISTLKAGSGKDILVYGGVSFVASLLDQNLIDELHLFVNPVALGQGMSPFGKLTGSRNYRLVKAIPFDCGINVLFYEAIVKSQL